MVKQGKSVRARSSLARVLEQASGSGKLWEDACFVLADIPVDRAEARRILPRGMWLTEQPTATLFIANYPRTSFTVPYREAAVLIHVRTPLGRGVHCCWMIVDDDTALIYGRELLGYPKKLGVFEFRQQGERIAASVARRGVQVLTMDLERGAAESRPAPVFGRKTFNVSGPGQLFVINPIWMFRVKEAIHESYSARVTVKASESEFDPIGRLIAGEPHNGRLVVMDILGSRYNLPVGIAGPRFAAETFFLRFR